MVSAEYAATTDGVGLTLVLMIVLGAARSVLTKLYFQLGFTEDPFFVAILNVGGVSFAIPLFYLLRWWQHIQEKRKKLQKDAAEKKKRFAEERQDTNSTDDFDLDEHSERSYTEEIKRARATSHLTDETLTTSASSDKEPDLEAGAESSEGPESDSTREISESEHWVDRMPLWLKPLPGSFLRLLDTIFVSFARLYLAASIVEMMVSGLEIVLSVFAKKYLRKKNVAAKTWYGVAILTVGLVIIGFSNVLVETEASDKFALGIFFAVCKAIFRTQADFIDEYFMHDTEFPPILLIGITHFYGLLMGLPLYALVGPFVGNVPSESFKKVFGSVNSALYTMLLLTICFLAGIFAILSTFKTCVLTKNMFKGFRGLLVWTFGLIIFYSTGNIGLGEPWLVPSSVITLSGFTVMMGGLYVYSA